MQQEEILSSYTEFFNSIKDFRKEKRVLYPLSEILFLILCAQLADFESLRDYELFFKVKQDFLRRFYPYKNGCPSISTIFRVLSVCNPKFFEGLIMEIANNKRSHGQVGKSVVAVDGKTHKGTPSLNGHLLHTVSLYSEADRLVFGQKTTETKGGEIAIAMTLFDMIPLSGQIITGDSAFCYQPVIESIIKNKADFIIQVKMNQPTLFAFIEQKFQTTTSESLTTDDRYSTKKVSVLIDFEKCQQQAKWLHVESLVKIESYNKKGKNTKVFYYISSLKESPATMARYIRSHWCIENDLHWFLDVVFKEDARVIWDRNFATNESIVRRLALSAIKKVQALAAAKLNKKHVAAKSLRKILMADEDLFQQAIYAAFN
jgi:predicted transposase YbfD/YdcC